jgi:hypothetical protein
MGKICMPKNLYASIRNFLSHDARFASNPELCNKTLTILASSLAKRTWQKYSSAPALWERFADEVNGPKPVKFSKNSRILFMSWCCKHCKSLPFSSKKNHFSFGQ